MPEGRSHLNPTPLSRFSRLDLGPVCKVTDSMTSGQFLFDSSKLSKYRAVWRSSEDVYKRRRPSRRLWMLCLAGPNKSNLLDFLKKLFLVSVLWAVRALGVKIGLVQTLLITHVLATSVGCFNISRFILRIFLVSIRGSSIKALIFSRWSQTFWWCYSK